MGQNLTPRGAEANGGSAPEADMLHGRICEKTDSLNPYRLACSEYRASSLQWEIAVPKEGSFLIVGLAAAWIVLICGIANAQEPQVPIPQSASEVPGLALGRMNPAYVQTVGGMADVAPFV
jgi:hypothetical protein